MNTVDAARFTNNPLGVAALNFLDLAFNQKKVDAALQQYLEEPYIQHNPQVPTGIEAARVGLKAMLTAMPGFHYDFNRVLVDGDLVAVYSHVTTGTGDRGNAVVDIFRAVNGRFIEHWDVIQPVPETSANNNTMF
ncbi:MAG: nuclear transport factor 2 family protein [Anaerolineales bacterium]|jgi:predicted SnoaL-like aldol condensation-catalyzing enzyme